MTYTNSEMPRLGDLVSILGGETLGFVVGFRSGGFIKAATVRKDGRRTTAYYLLDSLSEPEPDNVSEMVRFYDTCKAGYERVQRRREREGGCRWKERERQQATVSRKRQGRARA